MSEHLMSGQSHLFPEPTAPEPAPRSAPVPAAAGTAAPDATLTQTAQPAYVPDPHAGSLRTRGAAPVWLQRLSLFILVLFCVYLGVLVTVLPWWSRLWDHNLWISGHPTLAAILHNGAVRGLFSGLGLLDIWIGISEAVHYRDYRA